MGLAQLDDPIPTPTVQEHAVGDPRMPSHDTLHRPGGRVVEHDGTRKTGDAAA